MDRRLRITKERTGRIKMFIENGNNTNPKGSHIYRMENKTKN
jgi:hypothetical protein